MTDHGSIRAITRLARRGCPVADRLDLMVADREGLSVLAGLAATVAGDPRENRAALRFLPLRRAALMPPIVAAAVAAAAPKGVPRSVGVASERRPESGSPDVESLALGPESVPVAVPADPSGSVAG